MVGQWNGLAIGHILCSLILLITYFILSSKLNATEPTRNNVFVSHSIHWNQGIFTMMAIVSIRMGEMIDHGSWPMSWLAALWGCNMCRVSTYLYVHRYVLIGLITTPVFHPFIPMREGGLHTNSYMSWKLAGIWSVGVFVWPGLKIYPLNFLFRNILILSK